MSTNRLIITAVVIEGRSQSEVARDYKVSKGFAPKTHCLLPPKGRESIQPEVTATEVVTHSSVA